MKRTRVAIGLLFLLGASIPWHDAAAQQNQPNGETRFDVLQIPKKPKQVEIYVGVIVVDPEVLKEHAPDLVEVVEGMQFDKGYLSKEFKTAVSDVPDVLEKMQKAGIVLLDVEVEVAIGETVAILGPDGLGKSTILNQIIELEVTPQPSPSGTISLNINVQTSNESGAPGDGTPVLALRSANTTLPLRAGQTAAIAGLLLNQPAEFGQGDQPARGVALMLFGLDYR